MRRRGLVAPVRLGTLEGHEAWVTALAFTGCRLASASYDCTVRVWTSPEAEATQEAGSRQREEGSGPGGSRWASRPKVLRHAHPVAALCSVAQGCLLAAGGYDHCVHIWCPVDGVCLHVLRGHGETVWSLCATHDGASLFSGAADNTLRLWLPTDVSDEVGGAHASPSHAQSPRPRLHSGEVPAAATEEEVPLAERHVHQMVAALAQRLLSAAWVAWQGQASGKTPVEWHDLFGAECTLRRPVLSLLRAWREVFNFGHAYYRRP